MRASWLTGRAGVVLLTCLIAAADYLTGAHTRFPGMYSLPVALAGWYVGLGWAAATALVGTTAGYLFQAGFVPPLELGIDTGSRLLGMLVLAFFVHRARLYDRTLEARVQTLEGILPICAHWNTCGPRAGSRWRVKASRAS